MTRREALELLKGGPEGVAKWNEWRKHKSDKESLPDLGRALLMGPDANLLDGILVWEGDDTDLCGADLGEANLSEANLLGMDLSEANLSEADLSEADLSKADLTAARFIRTNLTDAVVDNAIVQDIQIQELRGLPVPPSILRLGRPPKYTQLTGDAAANFFVLPAIVEVYLTRELADAELGCLHFHQGEVHAHRVGADVYLVGHRHEAGGSVLRFQGPTYDAVYAALPDLLAAFRTTEAIDWKKTLDALPKDERSEAITALVKAETRLKTGRWRIAERLADAFANFKDARVVKLVEGRKKGVSITVFTDEAMAQRLARAALPSAPTGAVLMFPGPSTHYHGDTQVGDNINIGGNAIGSAIGTGASVTAGQIIANIRQGVERSADADLVAAVKAALDAITGAKLAEHEQVEAAQTIEKIQKEAEKRDVDAARPGRLNRWLGGLADICKPAADVLAAAKAVAVALGA